MHAAPPRRAVAVYLGVLIGFVVACGLCVVLNIQRLHSALQPHPAALQSACRELDAQRSGNASRLTYQGPPQTAGPLGARDAISRVVHMFPPPPVADEVR